MTLRRTGSRSFIRSLTAAALCGAISLSNCANGEGGSDPLLFGFTSDLLLAAITPTTDEGTQTYTTGVTIRTLDGGYIIPENQANGTLDLTIVLNSPPTADVVIPLSMANPAESAVSPESVTFTPDNWNVPQNLVITGVIEPDIDGNQITSLVFGAAESDDPEYGGLVAPSITGIIAVDDDAPSIIVSAPPAGLVTTETGTADVFAVVLSHEPTANVVVPATIVSSDTTEGLPDMTTLTFTPANWSTPQIVTVTGVDDVFLDGNVNYTVDLPNSTSADGDFNNLQYFSYHNTVPSSSTNSVQATNIDNETPVINVTPTVLNLTENGANGTFNVSLGTQPPGNVTISVTNPQPGRANVTPTLLTFTTGNFSTPQTVTVDPIDNDLADGNVSFVVDLGTATNYQNTEPDDVTVNITDNETASIVVSTLSRNTTEAGQNANFTVVLTSEPTANVDVTLSDTSDSKNAGNSEGTIDKYSLTFTPANWDTPQTVTVTPTNEDIFDGNVQWLVSVSNATSADPDYSGLAPTPNFVTVNNVDDDIGGFTIVANGQTTNTAGSAGTISGLATDDSNQLSNSTYSSFTIRLRSEPTANVVLNFTANGPNNDGRFTDTLTTTTSRTFTPANWATPQTVTLYGASDGSNEGNQDYSVSVTPVTTDDKYSNTAFVARPSFSLHSCDNDVANVIVGCRRSGSFGTTESGGTATLWMITQSDPGGTVTVAASSSDTTEGVVTTSPATVTSGNWNTMGAAGSNRLIMTGQSDALFDNNILYTFIIDPPTTGGAIYTSFNPPDFQLYNTDDEQLFEFDTSGSANTSEALENSSTFLVRLRTAPAADVTVSISCGNSECKNVSPTSVTYTTGNWNVYQTVTYTGKDDNRADGPQGLSVSFGAASSTDLTINGITPPAITPAQNLDDDKVVWTTNANSGTGLRGNFNAGLGVADTFCNDGTDLNKPNGYFDGVTYKALLVDSGTRVATTSGTDGTGQLNWVLTANTSYYLGTGGSPPYTSLVFTTNSYGTFTFGTLTTAFSGSGTFWTGLNTDWTTNADNCSNWTNDTAGFNGRYGVGGATGATSISSTTDTCATQRQLICVQQ